RPSTPPARRPPRLGARLGRPKTRLSVGFGAVCVLLLVVTGRLVQLQGIGDNNYAADASAERLTTVSLHAARGSIVDRNGVVMAYTADAKDIVADPTQVATTPVKGATCTAPDKVGYAMKLAPLTGVAVDVLVAGLSKEGQYALLAKAIPPGQASQIDDLNLCGIYVESTTERLYPGQTTGANVVGFVHSDGEGGAGIEEQYNGLLSGTDGTYTYERTATGSVNPAGVSQRTAAVNGGSVTLTISQDLQYWVQAKLDEAIKDSGARSGQVVVQDAKTGQILALAGNNTYNSQDPDTVGKTVSENAPIQTAFEPGSVNKVVTFSAALEKGLITPTTVLSVPDVIQMGGVAVHDAWWHPAQNFTATGILAESSNVGTLEIAQKVGAGAFQSYLKAYGMGKPTGIELPGESAGVVREIKDWSDSTFSNLPIGQGVSMTALQMTSMYQTIANNGVRIEPRIVESVTNPDGSVVATKPPAGVRVTSATTAETLRTMLESVMLKGGTGTKAAIPGYRIAGKTGTAQQPDPTTGQYSASIYWDTYAGIAPADDPRFVVGIMIDNPAHGLHGGDVAAPLYKEIAAYELQHEGIAPSGSQSTLVPLTIP
ncbi:MAG: ftsI, partial [Pseudonocardiales bacterium]|nr:ftsI [Pseudonocardiales bacterium]